MAVRGQRFTLDPDADNFTFNIDENDVEYTDRHSADLVGEIKERVSTGVPPPPKPKKSKTGFPQPRARSKVSTLKSQQQQETTNETKADSQLPPYRGPSDRAIVNQVSRKYGLDLESKQEREKQEISDENKKRIAQMSTEDIDEARSEIMANFSPAFLERFLKRANIEEDQHHQSWDNIEQKAAADDSEAMRSPDERRTLSADDSSIKDSDLDNDKNDGQHSQQQVTVRDSDNTVQPQFLETPPLMHFPQPPRNPDDYVPLDPNSPSFLQDLKKHYFPSFPNDPSTLAWLQDPTDEESNASSYAPTQTRYAASDIRFDFTGRLLPPTESRLIPVSKGLHHHGEAPESAGYTIPELSILARSALPNQRCIAYQILGRMLYRLGHGEFGQRGSELQEGLWACVEKERPIEVIMSEANRAGGHVSAKAYATEALWLWRKGGGGDRGVLKPGETIAK